MRIGIDRRFRRSSPSFLILLMLFFALFLAASLLIIPPASAETRGAGHTLRSKLYEHFRCGNDVCDIVENAKSCPADCAEKNETVKKEAEQANKTAQLLPLPQQEDKWQKEQKGLTGISTIIPSESIYQEEEQNMPKEDNVFSSQKKIYTFGIIIFVVLCVMIGILVLYEVKDKIPFLGRAVNLVLSRLGITKGTIGQEAGESSASISAAQSGKAAFSYEVPPAPPMTAQIVSKTVPSVIAQQPKSLIVVKKDQLIDGIKALISKLKLLKQQKQKLLYAQQAGMQQAASSGVQTPVKATRLSAQKFRTAPTVVFTASSGISKSDSSGIANKIIPKAVLEPAEHPILNKLIADFKKNGLSIREIRGRIRQIGLWNEETINSSLEQADFNLE